MPPLHRTFQRMGFRVGLCFVFLVHALWIFMAVAPPSLAVDISNSPLTVTYKTPPPAVMFLLDDSLSMDAEVLTIEPDGYLDKKAYVFEDSMDDNATSLHPVYEPNDKQLRNWKSQWYRHNRIYYNPQVTYTPWPNYTGSSYTFGDASPSSPLYDPRDASSSINLSDSFYDDWSTDIGVNIRNSHYFLSDGSNIYLVNIISSSQKDVYVFNDKDGDDIVDKTELTSGSLPASLQFPLTIQDDLQNFANWFQYYRKRYLCALAAVSQTVVNLSEVYVGMYSINETAVQPVLKIKMVPPGQAAFVDETNAFLEALYTEFKVDGGTNLREALVVVGEYFRGNDESNKPGDPLGAFAFDPSLGGSCQKTYAILMTDGYWNEDPNWHLGGITPLDVDGDTHYDTLADVAAFYSQNDLDTSISDQIIPTSCNSNVHQNLVTFTVSFGLNGTMDPSVYDSCDTIVEHKSTGAPPSWGDPFCGTKICEKPEKIDDLWHAATNSNGKFFNVSDPQALAQSLEDIFDSIADDGASTAALTVQNEGFYETNTYYQSFYYAGDWTGKVEAVDIGYNNLNPTDPFDVVQNGGWEADSDTIPSYGNRVIITYDNEKTSSDKTIPFQWASLNATQQAAIEDGSTDGDLRVDYLRGRDSNGAYRNVSKLGDIVHASPVPVPIYIPDISGATETTYTTVQNPTQGTLIFVAANDGMLHAFNAVNGDEVFAYVPNLVVPNLKELLAIDYAHRYYVDQTPVYHQIMRNKDSNGKFSWDTYVVGGLNAGGKGYYCLEFKFNDQTIKPFTSISEASLVTSNIVKWEFTDADDLGYTFSSPAIVNSNMRDLNKDPIPVVIFGNGYNSANGFAKLFVINLFTGEKITDSSGNPIVFDTKIGSDNGMSSPIVIDINNDDCGDFVYAGDLKGNLWKIDISSDNPDDWDFAFKKDKLIPTSEPAPFFTTLNGRPITSRPDVMRHCCRDGYMVCFGTGKFLGSTDLNSTAVEAIYGIWDFGDQENITYGTPADPGEFLGPVTQTGTGDYVLKYLDSSENVTLVVPTIKNSHLEDGVTLIEELDSSAILWSTEEDKTPNSYQWYPTTGPGPWRNPTNHVGWMINLPNPRERLYLDVMIQYGYLFFYTVIPDDGYCTYGTRTLWYNMFNPCTGETINETILLDKDRPLPPIDVDNKIYFESTDPNKPTSDTRLILSFKKLYFWNETGQ